MKKSTVCLILALVLLFTALPLSAHAAEGDPVAYKLWVNNEQITSDHLTVACGEGTATFDPATTTLTLDNAEITKGVPIDQLYTGVLTFLDEELTVIINGDCTITETGGDGIGSYEFDSHYQMVPHDITVKGDGTLTITESTRMYGYGVYCTGHLTLDGVKLTVRSAASGIWSKTLTVRDSELDIACSSQFSGFVVNNGDFVYENSTAVAESAEGVGLLLGNNVDASRLTVNSGSLTLKGKGGIASDAANSTVTVNGGRLAIEGQTAAFSPTLSDSPDEHIFLGEGVEITSGAIDSTAVTFEKVQSGYTVSGSFTSYLGVNGITIELLQDDVQKYSAAYADDSGSYAIHDVAAGDYILRVSKTNHVTRDYDLTVTGDTEQDVKICPIGDANLDGKISPLDVATVNNYLKGKKELEDYALACADVIGTDGKVTPLDISQINLHIKDKKSLWK